MVRVSQGNFQGNFDQGKENLVRVSVACSHTLYFSLQSPSSARDKNKHRGGIIDRRPFLALDARPRSLSLADVFEKNEKKNKTTVVYKPEWRIQVIRVDWETTGDESAPTCGNCLPEIKWNQKTGLFLSLFIDISRVVIISILYATT